MRVEPGFGLSFRDDGEDADFFFGDVIEHPDLVHAESILEIEPPNGRSNVRGSTADTYNRASEASIH